MEFRDEQMPEEHLCIPNTLPAIQDELDRAHPRSVDRVNS